MAETIDLIHAGLPWNNPQKITVKADQYISQLVINRGLLNLLSNDYYLDLKTERINQYIVQLLGPHINDATIHHTEEQIIDIIKRFLNGELGNYLDGFGLLRDTAFLIPIDRNDSFPKNVNKIQNIINNCPKNLNGHTAIFALTEVSNDQQYYHNIGEYYTEEQSKISPTNPLDIVISYKSINLNNFYGGTVILMGNDFFTLKEYYKDTGKSLNNRQTRILIEQIQNKIDNPSTPLMTLKGNGNNNSCAVVSFNNCNCDTYIWNLNIQLDSNDTTSNVNDELPQRQDLAFFFPANTQSDITTGNIRYLVADSINNENFNQTYLTLRSNKVAISGTTTEGITTNTISAINLNNDYLSLNSSYGAFAQTFFGKYINEDQVQNDSVYDGATLCFWMKDKFYDNNIAEVPILYNVDSNGNGYYFGLEKIAAINNREINNTQYIETTYAAKKKADLNDVWRFWAITIKPSDLSNNQYKVGVTYVNTIEGQTNDITSLSILPNKTTTNGIQNLIKFQHLNLSYPITFFGTPNVYSSAYIRNILLFNKVLTTNQINGLAKQGIENIYNLPEAENSTTFQNSMKGALYVYNTTSMNVIGCNLSKKENNG